MPGCCARGNPSRYRSTSEAHRAAVRAGVASTPERTGGVAANDLSPAELDATPTTDALHDVAELREFGANPRRKIALGWMLVVPALALLIVSRWQLGPDSYWLSLALLAASILLRPLFYRSIRNVGKGA